MFTDIQLLSQTLLNGLFLSGIFIACSSGLSLAYGVLHIINVAYGEFMMLAAFSAYWMCVFTGLDPVFSTVPIFFVFFLCGYLLQKFVVNRISVGQLALKSLVFFFGLSVFLANLSLLTLGSEFKIVSTPLSSLSLKFAGLYLPIVRLIILIVSLAVVLSLYLFLKYSWVGKAIRATANNVVNAQLCGVDVNKIYAIVMGLSVGIAGASGCLVSSIRAIHPTMGGSFILYAFLISVLGGLGYFPGTLIGGLIIGFLDVFINTFFVAQWNFLLLFIILWVILLLRPKGIFGRGM